MWKKIVDIGIITAIVFVFCMIGYFWILLPYLNRGEGDPYFVFTEVPVNVTANSTIIHLEDKDILNVHGLDVRQENGKIIAIMIRESENPEISPWGFYGMYGSRWDDPTSRKYLEYKGIYYYATIIIP
jgi:hypothetical protein